MELVVHCTDPTPFDSIMSKCAESIKYIDLTYDGMPYKRGQPMTGVTFPELKFLCLTNKLENSTTNWSFNGNVSNLAGVFLLGRTGTIRCPSSVIYLGTTKLIDLSEFRGGCCCGIHS